MKLERSKNAIRNAKIGIVAKAVSLLFPFAIRTVFIYTLGAEYLGVNSLFTSVLSVLSLAELGFGSAIVYNMYNAIADDDTEKINALLAFYKNVYRLIGLIILALGLAVVPFLDKLVKGSYPQDINPIIVYLIFLGNTVLSYFLFAYLNSLLNAFQRVDISSLITMLCQSAMYIVQIILLLTVKNYYLYLAIMPLFTIISNIITAIAVKKRYPQYRPFGKLDLTTKLDIKEKVSGLLISKVCMVSRNAFDSIFVSMFLGLTQIAMYNNYYYIISSLTAVFIVFSTSILAGAGNSVAIESQSKNHEDMMKLNFGYMWLSGWATVCLVCLYQPFMKIWVGKDLLLPFSSAILFALYFYVLKMGDLRSAYADAKGIWWHDRYRALAEAVANIVLNYVLGKFFGINGIIAATLISLFFINFLYGTSIIYKYYFTEQKISQYYLFHARNFLITIGIGIVTYLLCSILIDNILGLIIRIIICIFVPNLLYFLILRKTKGYQDAVPWFMHRFHIDRNGKLWKLIA